MVKLKNLQLSGSRLCPEMTKGFLQVGQLFGWELTRGTRTFTGLVIVGEKSIPQGFQTMIDCTLDTPVGPQVPMETAGEIVRKVVSEFQQRGTVALNPPGQKPPMGKVQVTFKVDSPSCGHKGPIQGAQDPATGEWTGKCVQCGAPAKVEMVLPNPPFGAN